MPKAVTAPTCQTRDFRIRKINDQGALGTYLIGIAYRNITQSTCTTDGFPGVTLYSHGRKLVVATKRRNAHFSALQVRPGRRRSASSLPALPVTRTSVSCGHRSGRYRPEQHAVRAILDPAGKRLLLRRARPCTRSRPALKTSVSGHLVGDGSRCLGALQRTCVDEELLKPICQPAAFAWLMLIRRS